MLVEPFGVILFNSVMSSSSGNLRVFASAKKKTSSYICSASLLAKPSLVLETARMKCIEQSGRADK